MGSKEPFHSPLSSLRPAWIVLLGEGRCKELGGGGKRKPWKGFFFFPPVLSRFLTRPALTAGCQNPLPLCLEEAREREGVPVARITVCGGVGRLSRIEHRIQLSSFVGALKKQTQKGLGRASCRVRSSLFLVFFCHPTKKTQA